MNSDRRQFLFGVPALAGISFLPEPARAQDEPAAPAPPDPELIEYWTKMGVPASALPLAAAAMMGAAPRDSLYLGGVDSEPIFLYLDPDKNELFPAQELPKDRTDQMLQKTDAQVQMAMQRLRLSGPDEHEFRRYNSGGLLFDVQQGKAGAKPNTGNLAWSVFSAIFPGAKPSATTPASPATPSNASPTAAAAQAPASAAAESKKKKGSRGMAVLTGAMGGLKGGIGGPALQPLEQVHTVQLPNGVGKAKLTVFVKDRKKSVFGTLVNTFTAMAGGALGSYLTLLNLGAISQPALLSVQTLVGKLHLCDDQRMLFGTTSDIELVASRDQIQTAANAVKLVPGNYIVVRKGHLSQFSGKTTNVKVFDGYLIPNNSDFATYYDQATEFISGVSYLSLGVTVTGAKPGAGCRPPEA